MLSLDFISSHEDEGGREDAVANFEKVPNRQRYKVLPTIFFD